MKKEPANCPICTASASRPNGEVYPYGDPQYVMRRCASCQSEFSAPLKAAASEFYTYETPEFRWEFGEVVKMLPEGARVLDVGCSDGAFVSLLGKSGFDATGIDFNRKKIELAQGRGLKCQVANVQEVTLGQEKFDAISAFHVIEHLERPADFLEDVKSALNETGRLYVSCPNVDRFLLEFRRDEPDYPPNHLTRISKDGMAKLANRAGFKIVHTYIEPHDVNWRRATSEASNRLVDLFRLRETVAGSRLINILAKLVLYALVQPWVLYKFLSKRIREGYTSLYVLERV